MLFHTWPFLVFSLIVLPVYFALAANPFLDPLAAGRILLLLRLVEPAVPAAGDLLHAAGLSARHADGPLPAAGVASRPGAIRSLRLGTGVHRRDRVWSAVLPRRGLPRRTFGHCARAASPSHPGCLMAVGACLASRRVWLLISLINNLALLLFFKYARFVDENLNALFAAHAPSGCTCLIRRR